MSVSGMMSPVLKSAASLSRNSAVSACASSTIRLIMSSVSLSTTRHPIPKRRAGGSYRRCGPSATGRSVSYPVTTTAAAGTTWRSTRRRWTSTRVPWTWMCCSASMTSASACCQTFTPSRPPRPPRPRARPQDQPGLAVERRVHRLLAAALHPARTRLTSTNHPANAKGGHPAPSEPVRTRAPRAPPYDHPRQPNRQSIRNRERYAKLPFLKSLTCEDA